MEGSSSETLDFNVSRVEEALRQTICGEDNEPRARTSGDDIIPIVEWEEATALMREAEEIASRKTFVQKAVATRAKRSFRWVVRCCGSSCAFVAIDGDVGSVYPGLDRRSLLSDAMCLTKYFPVKVQTEMYLTMLEGLRGTNMNGRVMTYHSLPEYDFIVQIEIHATTRYRCSRGRIIMVQTGETRDSTRSMKDYAKVISKIASEHRETVDHRFGNKIRLMHLLLESGKLAELDAQFDRLEYEVQIRRKLFDNLPKIAPISPEDFLVEFANLDYDVNVTSRWLSFRSLEGDLLSPIVLQVLVLQDIASNCYKHGNGKLDVIISPDSIVFRNRVQQKKQKKQASRHIGLGALRHACSELNLAIDFSSSSSSSSSPVSEDDEEEEDGDWFTVTLRVGVEFAAVGPPAPAPRTRRHGPSDFTWVLVEDDAVICSIFKKVMAKRYEVEVNLVSTPPEVAHVHKTLAHLSRRRRRKRQEPIICILDENLLEMDDEGDVVAVTGTQLRDRFVQFPPTKQLLDFGRLWLVSASASDVADDRVLLKLGKTGSTASDVTAILDAISSS